MSSLKPLIILHSRKLTNYEQKLFYKHFNSIILITPMTASKKLTDFTANDVIFADITTQIGRDWWSMNSKLADANVDNICWMRASGDKIADADSKTEFNKSIRYENKRIPDDITTKADLLHSLFALAMTPSIDGKKKRFLQKLFSCLCSAAK
jgi:hypothetical protein